MQQENETDSSLKSPAGNTNGHEIPQEPGTSTKFNNFGSSIPLGQTGSANAVPIMNIKLNDSNTSEPGNTSQTPDDELWLLEQRVPNEVRLKYNSDRWVPSHPLVDVLFVFQDAKLGAHKFILLDSPVYEFFRKGLLDKTGSVAGQRMLTFIDVPPDISLEGVEACLSYIYGKKIDELQVDAQNFEKFIDAAVYLTMDIQLLPSLLKIESGNKLATFVSSNFPRLSKAEEFWNMDNQIILDLCKEIQPTVLEDVFFDFICGDKANRKSYLDKLIELRNLIKTLEKSPDSNTDTSSSDSPEDENENSPSTPTFRTLPKRNRRKRKLSVESSKFEFTKTPKAESPNLSGKRRKSNASTSFIESKESSTNKSQSSSNKGARSSIIKPNENGADRFCKEQLQLIREYVAKGIYKEDLKESWHGLFEQMNTNKLVQNLKNCKRFYDDDGLKLIFELRDKFPEQIEMHQISLDIVATFAEKEELRELVFSTHVVDYVLKELQNFDNHKNSTTAGEILSFYLTTNEPDPNDWDAKEQMTRRDYISKEIRAAIGRWDISFDRNTHFSSDGFNDLISLIEARNRTANLYGLWTLTYFTSTGSGKSQLDLDKRKMYCNCLRKADIGDTLKYFANCDHDGEETGNISYYAKTLAKNLGIKL